MVMMTLLFCMVYGCTAGPSSVKVTRTYAPPERGEAVVLTGEGPWQGVVTLLQHVAELPPPRALVCYTQEQEKYRLEVFTREGVWRPVSRAHVDLEEAVRWAPRLAELQGLRVEDLMPCVQLQPWADAMREEGRDPRYVLAAPAHVDVGPTAHGG